MHYLRTKNTKLGGMPTHLIAVKSVRKICYRLTRLRKKQNEKREITNNFFLKDFRFQSFILLQVLDDGFAEVLKPLNLNKAANPEFGV